MDNIHHIYNKIIELNNLIDKELHGHCNDGYLEALCQRLNSELDALLLEKGIVSKTDCHQEGIYNVKNS